MIATSKEVRKEIHHHQSFSFSLKNDCFKRKFLFKARGSHSLKNVNILCLFNFLANSHFRFWNQIFFQRYRLSSIPIPWELSKRIVELNIVNLIQVQLTAPETQTLWQSLDYWIVQNCIVHGQKYFHTTILRISSGTFRLALQIAWAEEWEKMTGALDPLLSRQRCGRDPPQYPACSSLALWSVN